VKIKLVVAVDRKFVVCDVAVYDVIYIKCFVHLHNNSSDVFAFKRFTAILLYCFVHS